MDNEQPEEILDTVLTEEEKDILDNIKYELGICIRWGSLTTQFFKSMLKGIDTLIFLENEKEEPAVVKQNPYQALFDSDKKHLNGPERKASLKRKYVSLLLLKKLLGALKTRVNQELQKIEIMDDATAEELRALILEDPVKEEIDFVGTRKSRSKKKRPEIIATVSPNKSKNLQCQHKRTTIRQVRSNQAKSGLDEMHSYCRDCKQVYEVKELDKKTHLSSFFNRFKQGCQHPRVQWKEGEEGKTAICSNSDCATVIDNPQRFNWVDVGLEPFGDDPSEDEITTIPAKGKEMFA